jgi:hypothetical protein
LGIVHKRKALALAEIKAQRSYEFGDWQESKVWRRAPDGRIFIDLIGYERWVERR